MLSPHRNRFGRRLREPFGKAGLTVAVIALVFAMFGGAYAAVGLNSKQKKEVKAIAKSFRGSGPAGLQGAKGDAGAAGAAGANGGPGKDGTSVVNSAEPKGAKCKEGGTKVVGTSTTYVCNGEKGKAGSPWTLGGTLPSENTETGTWAFGQLPAAAAPSEFLAPVHVPISFSIPLAESLSASKVHYVNAAGKEENEFETGVTPVNCLGSAAAPSAPPGHLCIYTGKLSTGALSWSVHITDPVTGENGAATSGARFGIILTLATAPYEGSGTWAVTAL